MDGKKYYIGIDQSYTSTGICILDENCELYLSEIISSDKNDNIYERALQIKNKLNHIISNLNSENIFIAIEGLAFTMTGNATRDLAGLQFVLITYMLENLNKTPVIISPPSLKKSATGNGKADKNAMIEALPAEIKDFFITQGFKKTKGLTDITDAYFLAKSLI